MSTLEPVQPAGDATPATSTAGSGGRVSSFTLAHGRTVGYAFLAVAAISVAAQLAVPIPGTPVPVSLQDLVVMLIGVVLGPTAGASAVMAYLGLGAAGAPVFSNGHAGLLWLFGPTGGYLLAYPAACWVVGAASRPAHQRIRVLAAVLLAQLFIYAGGSLQLVALTGQNPGDVVALAVIPFLPGAALKIAIVVAFAEASRKWRSLPRRG